MSYLHFVLESLQCSVNNTNAIAMPDGTILALCTITVVYRKQHKYQIKVLMLHLKSHL